MGCHLCTYGSARVPLDPIPALLSHLNSVGVCGRCCVLACRRHGSRGGTGAVSFRCADCSGRYTVMRGSGGPPPDDDGGFGEGPQDAPPDISPGGGIAADDPSAIQWSLPELSADIDRLTGLFDQDRLAEALTIVAGDTTRFDPLTLGQALRSRLLAAIHEQDSETLRRILSQDDPGPGNRSIDDLRAIAAARAGALGVDLERDVDSSARQFSSQVSNPPLVAAGLAALCAAHGFDPERIFAGALGSPLDIPGALYLPAISLQVLFAYTDGEGLGPAVQAEIELRPMAPGGTAIPVGARPALIR